MAASNRRGGDPQPADPLESIDNVACVAADLDSNDENNCDDDDDPTRDITGVVYTSCQSDAPLLGWVIKKSASLASTNGSARVDPVPGEPGGRAPECAIRGAG